ncbi:hypothetical protein WICMUC_002004 [Wickerhamomyces mucosus]|uniref:Uncharacterized protein n=1 Tax=Wickerhamomyces mucosus TaxID=1378264 RepID=A0A9P8PQD1_9ASCO|nr:hypothetical protein WICMUC_002004 [Wickerhamomyces mucosus]
MINSSDEDFSSPIPLKSSTFNLKKTISNSIKSEQQLKLQQQQLQFQQQFQQQQQYQQSLQLQMAAKYGSTGAPLSSSPSEYPAVLDTGVHQKSFDQWGDSIYQPLVQTSYNKEQNSLAELQFLRKRVREIESQFPDSVHNNGIDNFDDNSIQITIKKEGSIKQDENNIDPAFFDEDEDDSESHNHHQHNDDKHHDSNQHLISEDQYSLYNHSNGLFEGIGFLKRDVFYNNFYSNLIHNEETWATSYNKKLHPKSKKSNKKESHYLYLLENDQYEVENIFKFENVNLNNIIKSIEKNYLIFTKKSLWIILDKFFNQIAVEFLPIFTKDEFYLLIEPLVGQRELVDTKFKLSLDIKDDDQLINFTFLLLVIKIVQISLKSTFYQDKDTLLLVKSFPSDNDIETQLKILIVCINNLQIDLETKFRLISLQLFINSHNYEPIFTNVKIYESDLLNLKSNSNLQSLWKYLYDQYYSINAIDKGLAILLSPAYFQSKVSNNTDTTNSLHGINPILYQIITKLTDFNKRNLIPILSIERLLQEYEELINLQFTDFKKSQLSQSEKVLKTLKLLTNLKINSNISSLITLQLDKTLKNKERFLSYFQNTLEYYFKILELNLDILKNYNEYFKPNYEFLLIPSIIQSFEIIFNGLIGIFLKFIRTNKNSLSLTILRFFYNIVDELEGYPILKQYFQLWKILNRLKSFIVLIGSSYSKLDEQLKILKDDDKLITNLSELSISEDSKISETLSSFNQYFDNDLNKLEDFEEFLQTYKFAESELEFNVNLFK